MHPVVLRAQVMKWCMAGMPYAWGRIHPILPLILWNSLEYFRIWKLFISLDSCSLGAVNKCLLDTTISLMVDDNLTYISSYIHHFIIFLPRSRCYINSLTTCARPSDFLHRWQKEIRGNWDRILIWAGTETCFSPCLLSMVSLCSIKWYPTHGPLVSGPKCRGSRHTPPWTTWNWWFLKMGNPTLM